MGVWVLGQLMKIPNLEVVFFFLCVSERWTALWHVVLGLYTSLKAVNICVKK